MRILSGAAVALSLFVAAVPTATSAEEAAAAPARIGLQLNMAEQVGEQCRISFVARNGMQADIGAITLELVLFSKDGTVGRFLLVDLGRLPAGRTRVRQFDIDGGRCTDFASILVNDVPACEGEGLTPQLCLDGIAPSQLRGAAGIRLES